MSMTKAERAEKECLRQEAIAFFRKHAPPGTTLYTTVKHVSRSGMYREILVCLVIDNQIRNVAGWASDLLGWKLTDSGSIAVSGVGMDMGFHLVHSIASVVWAGTPEVETFNFRGGGRSPGYLYEHSWL